MMAAPSQAAKTARQGHLVQPPGLQTHLWSVSLTSLTLPSSPPWRDPASCCRDHMPWRLTQRRTSQPVAMVLR